MSETNQSNKTLFVVGMLGIFALLIGSLAYAVWESSTHYQQDRINQFVVEQSAQEMH